MEPTSENTTDPQVAPSTGKPSTVDQSINTEDGLEKTDPTKTDFTAVADPATRNTADAGAPVGAPVDFRNARESVAIDDTRSWKQMLDDDDREAIEERIEEEVGSYYAYDESTVMGMLDAGCHPQMVVNTLCAQNGTPNRRNREPEIVSLVGYAIELFAAGGYEPTDSYRQHLQTLIRGQIEDDRKSSEWTREWLSEAVPATVAMADRGTYHGSLVPIRESVAVAA
jgi:hypothetical protein